MNLKDINYNVKLKASPEKVYNALMDSKLQTEWSGAPAEIENKEGGSFSAYGGALTGTNTKLEVNKKIVQQWRAGSWPEGHFSEVTYTIKADGNGSEIIFYQTGVPEDKYDEINGGWKMMYWDKLTELFS